MQPTLAAPFLQSPTWTKLTPAAQAALRGLLPFAIHRDCDWSVEASAQQVAAAIAPTEGLTTAAILAGLRELELVGCVRRYTNGVGAGKFVVRVALDEGPRAFTPIKKPVERRPARVAKRRKRA